MRKLFSVLSSTLQGGVRRGLLLLLLVASVSAIYASDTQVDGIWYDFDSSTKTASVTYRGSSSSSYEGEYSGSVVIPETVTYNGTTYSVTSIGIYAFNSCSSLTSVTIGNSVISIGNYAFEGCSSLTSVTIPNSVTSIGGGAFSLCSSLTSVTIPNSVTSIESSAFRGCSSLTSVTIPNSIKSIEYYTFYGCSSLTSVTIPNSVTSIEGAAFEGCSSLTSVTIPNSVTSIEGAAFEGCSSLTSVSIGESVRSISQSAFRNCALLSTIVVDKNNTKYDSREECNAIIETATNTLILGCQNTTIPNSVTSIRSYAFYGCSSMTSVTIPNSVTSIGDYAFMKCTSLTSVTIPNSIKSIGEYAFEGCSSLTSVTIPNSVTSIGSYAFSDCSSLTSVTIGNSVTSIGTRAFEGCSSLTSVTINSNAIVNKDYSSSANISHIFGSQVTEYIIGNKVKGIGYYAFYACSGLTSVTIPNSVTSIGSSAFYSCSSLTSVTIPNSVTSIGNSAFYGCSSLTSITIPESVTSIGSAAFRDCKSLSNIVVDKNNTIYDSREDCNAIILTATNTLILGCQNTTIPNSVTKIGGYAFYGCSGLTSVTISESVTSILNYAFYNCSKLTSVVIPNSVTSIGKYAFEYCSSLTSVTIGNSVTSIGDYAFEDCYKLTSVTINSDAIVSKNYSSSSNIFDIFGSQVTEYIIGDNVRGIGDYAFDDCTSLTSVTIGNSVTSIGDYAFGDCSKLTKTNYTGDIAGWCNIKFGNYTANPMCYSHNFYINNQEIKDLVIPNSVTSIKGYAFNNCSSLTSVTIPNSVTKIGGYAFEGCSSLTSVTIGNSVTSIGYEAFRNCSKLTSVTIGNSVTSIGNYAFDGCSSLTKTNYTGDIAGWCNIKFGSSNANPMYYSHNFYINDQEIKDLVIPNNVTSIGNYAFSGCSSLTSVTIPNSVTSIGDYAFDDCTSLTSVTIGNSVTSIGSSAFSGCSSLTSITCDAETPPAIGNTYTFYNFSTSIPIYVPCGCVEAYKAASGWKKFTNIQEPLAEYSIDVDVNDTIMGTAKVDRNSACGNQISATPKFGYHFVQWSDGNTDAIRTLELTQDTILTAEFAQSFSGQCGENLYWELTESTLHITGSGKMYDYTSDTAPWKVLVSSIKSLTIAKGVTSIGSYAFYNCFSLTSVTIGESVTSIGDYAFYGCYSLPVEDNLRYADTYLVEAVDKTLSTCSIKEGTKWVGNNAFDGCSKLTSVTIPNSVTSIKGYAFRNCSSLTSVTIPNSVTSIGNYAFEGCSSLTSVTIPNSVTSIGSWAFEDCSSLTSVTINSNAIVSKDYSYNSNISHIFGSQVTEYIIGNKVKGIGYYAFYNCSSLTSVTIPNSVTSIGISAFRYCSSLTSVTIGESVTSIGSYAFSGCSSLTSVTIPNSIKSIGYDAFAGCSSLTSVTIGESVTSIGSSAFSGCSSLTSITCEAATPPTLGSDAFDGVSKSIPVYVPCGCVEAYNTASGWEDFTNFQEPLAYSIEVNVNDTIMGTANVDYNTFCEGNQISATPNFGYHFVQWSDGNTDAIRTLELTQDTILTAEFAQSFSGQCGDDLYWNYDETAKTISITGSGKMYDYTATTQPWLLFKEQIVEVTTTNTVTSIGTSAFEGCVRLSKISLGTGLEEIAANAFAGCTRLYDIYTYATYPPFADESSFANYNVYVYIPCEYQRDYILDVVWGKFKFIECIDSEEATTDGNVTVVPGFNDVTITWPTESNADTYTIVIKKDGEVFCTLTFNAVGQLLNIAFAPSRNGDHRPVQYAEQAINGFTFTITGLDEGSVYTYDLVVKDRGNNIIQFYSGEFRTWSVYDRTVKVEYDAKQGKVTGAGRYLLGETVTLTAIPNEGYRFVGWEDGSTDNPRTLVLTQDTSLVAYFEIIYLQPDTVTLCYGETYQWHDKTYDASGVYVDTLSNGVATLHLTILPQVEETTEEATICAGEKYTWQADGKVYTESGIYSVTLQDINGCDSVVILHLTVNPVATTEETIIACYSYEWNNQTYTQSGEYTYTTTAANGCDSVVTLHLIINNTQYAEEYVVACDSYTWNGETYATTGAYTYTTNAANGCDSIVTLHLTILPDATTESETLALCPSELPYEWYGQSLTDEGTYSATEQYAGMECDSVIHELTLNVYVQTLPAAVTLPIVRTGGAIDVTIPTAEIQAHIAAETWYAPNALVVWYIMENSDWVALSAESVATGITEVTLKYVVDTDCGNVESDKMVIAVETTDVENTQSQSPTSNCRKILYEDYIYILREGKVYSVMGHEL